MLLVALLVYSATSYYLPIHATPTSITLSSRTEPVSLSPCSCPQLRSTQDIVWSCLATTFACTWVAIHPNSPGSNRDGKQRVLLRRLELMIWSILAPEMIIFWALRQWVGARRLAHQYKDRGWTMTHGHFLLMGGFMLTEGDHDIQILTPWLFQSLLDSGRISFPNISEEDISALGKTDGLAKIIVVGQTLWFAAQCVSRAVQGLAITEIELVTAAFALLNGLVYFLWWHKPLDASFVVRIETRGPETSLDDGSSMRSSPNINTNDQEPREKDLETAEASLDDITSRNRPPEFGNNFDSENQNPKRSRSTPNYLLSTISTTLSTLSHSIRSTTLIIWGRMNEMRGFGNKTVIFDTTRVPTFWPTMDPHLEAEFIDLSNIFIALIGMGFGAIHCAGWNFSFPTLAEKILWRISCLFISALPILVIAAVIRAYHFDIVVDSDRTSTYGERWILGFRVLATRVGDHVPMLWTIFLHCVPIYLLARVVLLVQAFISLRDLPSAAYLEVQWTDFLPHI